MFFLGKIFSVFLHHVCFTLRLYFWSKIFIFLVLFHSSLPSLFLRISCHLMGKIQIYTGIWVEGIFAIQMYDKHYLVWGKVKSVTISLIGINKTFEIFPKQIKTFLGDLKHYFFHPAACRHYNKLRDTVNCIFFASILIFCCQFWVPQACSFNKWYQVSVLLDKFEKAKVSVCKNENENGFST